MALRKAVLRATVVCAVTLSSSFVFAQGEFANPNFKSYTIRTTQPSTIEASLRQFLADQAQAGEQINVVSDDRGSQLLVQGSARMQQLASQYIQTLDVPAVRPAVAQNNRRVQGYPAPNMKELTARLNVLRQRFGDRSDVRIAADERTRQLVVHAPEDVHQLIHRNWNNPKFFQSQVDAGTNLQRLPGVPQPRVQLANARQQVRLNHIGWKDLLQNLRAVQGPTAAITSPQRGTLELNLSSKSGVPTQLLIDQSNQIVQISGTVEDTQEWTKVVQALDSQPEFPSQLQMMGRLGDAQPATITRTIAMLGAGGSSQAFHALPTGPFEDQNNTAALDKFAQPGRQPIQVAQADSGVGNAAAQGEGEVARLLTGDSSGSFLGPVRIEFLEGTDIFIVRGQKRDVDRVMQIINDIETLTEETEPAIEVYQLQHANSQAVGILLNDLNEGALQARQGDVSVTPLLKPNAILLIGRPAGVESVKKIIQQLDVETGSDDQFRVFHLTHLAAVDAERTLNYLYVQSLTQDNADDPTGLRPRIRIVADFRSNSIIVAGSQRDVDEVGNLISQIDVPGGGAVSDVRVFPLKNAVAEEIAQVLNDTLGTNQSEQIQSGQTQGQIGGGGQGSGSANTQARSSNRAMMLRIQVMEKDGKRLLDNETLESGVLSNVVVTFNERTNAVVVTAPADSMELIAEIVRQLDELPGQESEIRVFKIINGDATLMVEMLDSLFAQDDNADGPQIQSAAGTQESTLVPLRFSLDQRTNSIIASGNSADLRVVEAILLKLDSSDVSRRKNAVVEMQIAEAQSVADAITLFVQSRREAIQGIAQDTVSQYELLDQEVVAVAEPLSNKIIISATDRYFEDVMNIIKELDRRPDMVMVQVLIAEVSLSSTEELGVELGIQDSLLFNRGVIGSDGTIPGFNFNNEPLGSVSTNPGSARDQVAGQALSSFAVGRTNGELGYGGLVLSASNESLSVLLRALQESGRLDVLSRPEVLMNNNTLGEVTVGSQVPYVLGQSLNFGVVQNDIELIDVGIILSVTPRISPDGLVVLDVLAEKSDLNDENAVPIQSGVGGEIRVPSIDTTRAQTFVTARDGQTVILGGLITKNRSTLERKVPYLGDVPFFGRLFRSDSISERRTELLIILTPHIIRDESDIDRINNDEFGRMTWCLGNVIDTHGDIMNSGSSAPSELYPNLELNPASDEVPTPADIENASSDSKRMQFPGVPQAKTKPIESSGSRFAKLFPWKKNKTNIWDSSSAADEAVSVRQVDHEAAEPEPLKPAVYRFDEMPEVN